MGLGLGMGIQMGSDGKFYANMGGMSNLNGTNNHMHSAASDKTNTTNANTSASGMHPLMHQV